MRGVPVVTTAARHGPGGRWRGWAAGVWTACRLAGRAVDDGVSAHLGVAPFAWQARRAARRWRARWRWLRYGTDADRVGLSPPVLVGTVYPPETGTEDARDGRRAKEYGHE